MPGFKGYFLVEDDNGVFSSLGLFETPEQGKESSKFVATWIRDEKLDTIIPKRAQDHERPRSPLPATASWSPPSSTAAIRPRGPGNPGPPPFSIGETSAVRAVISPSEACTERGRLPRLLET